ncbi:MAG: glucose-6-phosphate isomerase [Candidatus Nanopelagicales bacterium]|jgi:glucose-6-phosphate isomerase|nr:glucose-6-phosphate isomerase [Candidatus Nanopelagicales bacterium]MDP4715931.1 glucose-6-phosphate isomerase [Candidatus Nanopelagicales bacterium]MDP4906538.1 glucose-6-phosphate isomerase [Candidatus Nanopelagicales bacterium]MDP4975904.1 glucose-6-phosphate isomerase [Candidatus Nanopelagicales bacterium]MDP5094982.1 glucose-6-phosphate isomerase [Candidatus Nanopelagicales bacterium]
MNSSESANPADTASWRELTNLAGAMRERLLRDLFAEDPQRASTLSRTGAGLLVDFSKQRITADVLAALLGLAEEQGVLARRQAMFDGEHINVTEDRAVMHTALRRPRDMALVVDGRDVVADVHGVLDRMAVFAHAVRDGSWTGATGRRIRNVINIGIGGSDLGPAMAYDALRFYSDRSLCFRFVSNIDPTDITEALRDLEPAETLFIIASKTFGTQETLTNARAARDWLVSALGEAAVPRHCVAVSTNAERVAAFGIDTDNMFGFWDWVGGRYSMESAIGLSTMVAIGPEGFSDLLAGFHAMDEHFRVTPPEANIPLLMGLIAVWNRDFLDIPTTAVLPYAQFLSRFPAYLQQLTMESNGKSVRLDGARVDYNTGAIYWGEPGTNGQHSFYQLLHQGTQVVACDFILFAQALEPVFDMQDMLAANALAQAAVLAFGRTADEVRADGTPDALVPHKVMPGNRPSTFIMAARLEPHALGAMIAAYEHSVFVQGAVWGIDSFDQWGVELGKSMAEAIVPDLQDPDRVLDRDSSTAALIRMYQALHATAPGAGPDHIG